MLFEQAITIFNVLDNIYLYMKFISATTFNN